MKTSFKILLLLIITTLLLWPALGYMFDPKSDTVKYYILTITVEFLCIITYVLFGDINKNK